jgi:hypothetical protein
MRFHRQSIAALAFAAAVACSGGDTPSPSPANPVLGDPVEQASAGDPGEIDDLVYGSADESRPLEIRSVRLSPDPPVSGEPVRASVQVSHTPGERYLLDYEWDVAGRTFHGNLASIELPRLRRGQRVRVKVTATNGSGEQHEAFAEAEIPNTPPQMMDLDVRVKPTRDDEAEIWEAVAWAQDPDSDPVTYEYTWLKNGREMDNTSSELRTASLRRGDRIRVRVVASDGMDESPEAESGTLEVGNATPEITSRPPTLEGSGEYRYKVEARDRDGDSLRYELVEGPQGMKLNPSSGDILWTPTPDQVGRHNIEVAVTDVHGGRGTQSFVIPIISIDGGAGGSPASVP